MSETDQTTNSLIQVHSCKYDGRIHRRWHARVASREGSLVILDAAFEEEIRHPLLGTIARGTISTEYYWTDRWYSVFRFSEPTGALRNYYCNINTPVEFDGRVLSFVDLDIDILVAPDFSYQVLDLDEFAAHQLRYGYQPDVCRGANQALTELIALIEKRQFPFSEYA